MLVDFKDLPDSSKIWIYQSNRSFAAEELVEIGQKLDDFLTQWVAHGSQLNAGYEIRYKRFIVIGLDHEQQQVSGCSIDASVHFIQSLEKTYKVDLLDRLNVSFKQGEYVAYKPLDAFRKMARNRSVSGQTIVFNNLVANKADYHEHWEVPASESWHRRMIK